MKKKILSFLARSETSSFFIGLALAVILSTGISSVIADGNKTEPFISKNSSDTELVSRIGSLTIGQNSPVDWINPGIYIKEGNYYDFSATELSGVSKYSSSNTDLSVDNGNLIVKRNANSMWWGAQFTMPEHNNGDVITVSGEVVDLIGGQTQVQVGTQGGGSGWGSVVKVIGEGQFSIETTANRDNSSPKMLFFGGVNSSPKENGFELRNISITIEGSDSENNGSSRISCLTGSSRPETETCLHVTGPGVFDELITIDIPTFVTGNLFLNDDASQIFGVPDGLIIEDEGGNDSIMATSLDHKDGGLFSPRDTTTQRGLCAEYETGELYPCTLSAPVESYSWHTDGWGECILDGGAGTCSGTYELSSGGSCTGTYDSYNKIDWNGNPYNWNSSSASATGIDDCMVYRISGSQWVHEEYEFDAYGFDGGSGASGQDPTCGDEMGFDPISVTYSPGYDTTPADCALAEMDQSGAPLDESYCIGVNSQPYQGCVWTEATESCSGPTSESTCESQGGSGECNWIPGDSTQTQTVVCQNTSGTVVADSFCDAASKPSETQSCTVSTGTPFTCTSSGWQIDLGECSPVDYDPATDFDLIVAQGNSVCSDGAPSSLSCPSSGGSSTGSAVPGASVWYCHLGSFNEISGSTCDNQNFPGGYIWGQQHVCTTATPTDDMCEYPSTSDVNSPSSANCTDVNSDNFWTCTD